MKQKPPEFHRQRAIERTTELALIKDRRKWTASEKAEFNILLEQLTTDNIKRRVEALDRERAQAKLRPELQERGIH